MPRGPFKLSVARRRLRYAGRRALVFAAAAALLGALTAADRLGWFGRAPAADLEKYDGKTCLVVRVVDGDTLYVDIPDEGGDRTRIRLWGVDTPETVKPNTPQQHFGGEASEFTKSAALNRLVRLELQRRRTRDKYGRLLAYVYLPDGEMLNRVLVKDGYGYADTRFDHKYKAEFLKLQRKARDAGLGLWKAATADDLPDYLRNTVKLPASRPRM